MIDGVNKAIIKLTSLAAVYLLSAKLVFACAGVVCDSEVESNLCAIFKNQTETQWYFTYSLIICVVVTTLTLALRLKEKGLVAVFVSFLLLFFPPVYQHLNNDFGCDRFYVELAKWSFYLLPLCLINQIVLWIFQAKKSKIQLP